MGEIGGAGITTGFAVTSIDTSAVTAVSRESVGVNVTFNVLFPGAIATNISVNSGASTQAEVDAMTKQGGMTVKTTPADIAGKLIVGAFEGNPFHAFAGSDAKLMYWWGRFLPDGAATMIQKQLASLLK